MKRIAISVLALALSAAAGSAVAQGYYNGPDNGPGTTRSDWAQVVSVDRVGGYPTGYEREQCWNEQTNNYDDGYYRDSDGRLYRGDASSSTKGAIIGALVGGALGNQVGKGNGRTAATVVGAVAGASIGANAGRNDDYDYRDDNGVVRRCRTVTVDNGYQGGGYSVTYRYAGQTYRGFTRYRPGNRVPVVVNVSLQDDGGRR